MKDTHAKPTKLLWVDLEMTGIEPERDVILEIAAEVTDFDFKTLASYHAVIAQDETKLASMNEWAAKQHALSGLTERVRREGRPEQEVVAEVARLIQAQFGDEAAVLAGNSIHQDRRFIRQWWPDIERLLHYRMLDVSAYKVYLRGKYDLEFKKAETHRALDDIHESIAELEYYLDWLRTPRQ